MTVPVLDLKGVSKRFGAVEALTDVDFRVDPGEVVALVGDNGAGKSTLVKAVSGVALADSGEFRFLGEPASISGPWPTTSTWRATSTWARSTTSRARFAGCGCWTTWEWRRNRAT